MLYLRWEHPSEMIGAPGLRACVYRQGPNNAWIEICDDAMWGGYIDRELDDTGARYEVVYKDARGNHLHRIEDTGLRRRVLGPYDCILTADLKDVQDFPKPNQHMSIMRAEADPDQMDLYSNTAGQFVVPLRQRARVIIRLQGAWSALDVIVPNRKDVTLTEMRSLGSLVPADRRGWF